MSEKDAKAAIKTPDDLLSQMSRKDCKAAIKIQDELLVLAEDQRDNKRRMKFLDDSATEWMQAKVKLRMECLNNGYRMEKLGARLGKLYGSVKGVKNV